MGLNDLESNVLSYLIKHAHTGTSELFEFFKMDRSSIQRVLQNLTEVNLIKRESMSLKAYEEMTPHLDWQNIERGITRHRLDFYYGISTTRALTMAIKKAAKRFSLLSTGRVQGPVLTLLAEKELQIKRK